VLERKNGVKAKLGETFGRSILSMVFYFTKLNMVFMYGIFARTL
jgi:hypothetical protein